VRSSPGTYLIYLSVLVPLYSPWPGDPLPNTVNSPEINRALLLEDLSFSTISIVPLTYRSADRPCLDYFETLPWFPYLAIQLCLWAVFATFYILFADFDQFQPIVEAVGIPVSWLELSEAGTLDQLVDDNGADLMFNAVALLFWIFVASPVSSWLFVLCYPRRDPLNLPAWVRASLSITLASGFLLLLTLSFLRLSMKSTAMILAVCTAFYLVFSVLWAICATWRLKRGNIA